MRRSRAAEFACDVRNVALLVWALGAFLVRQVRELHK